MTAFLKAIVIAVDIVNPLGMNNIAALWTAVRDEELFVRQTKPLV